MKRCYRCKENLPEDAFNKNRRRRDGLQLECRACRRSMRSTYQATDAGRAYSRAAGASYRAWLWEQKSRPCEDCGGTFHPAVMQFDHIPNRGEKLFSMNRGAGRVRASVVAEMAKCKLRCANCHAYVTHVERPADEL